MTLPQRFQVGDRVRTVRKIGGIRKGASGTVERAYPDAQLYDVRFDAPIGLRLMLGSELELIPTTDTST